MYFLDIRDLISVDDILEDKEMALGPNGALVFCMEYLTQNLEWLHDQINEAEDDYFLFDCPGVYNNLIKKYIITNFYISKIYF